MRIIIIGPAYPYRGGIAAFSQRLASEFVSRGHDVELITFTLQYPGFLFPGKTQYSGEKAPEGLKIVRMLSSVNPLSWERTGKHVLESGADLVIFAYWMSFFAPAYKRIAGIIRKGKGPRPMMAGLLHNFIPHEAGFLDAHFARSFARMMDGCICLSKAVADCVLEALPGKKVISAFHPVYDIYGEKTSREEACRVLGLDENRRYLLFFGLVRDYKGLDLLIEAYKGLEDRIGLIVAGEFYSGEEKYRSLASSLGLENKIVWRNDFIPDAQVRYYFSACDMVVLPYRSATQSGIAQIALQMETPMLVTRVGALGELVRDGETGYTAEPDAASIHAAILNFVDGGGNFGTALAAEKKRYGWDILAGMIDTSFENKDKI